MKGRSAYFEPAFLAALATSHLVSADRGNFVVASHPLPLRAAAVIDPNPPAARRLQRSKFAFHQQQEGKGRGPLETFQRKHPIDRSAALRRVGHDRLGAACSAVASLPAVIARIMTRRSGNIPPKSRCAMNERRSAATFVLLSSSSSTLRMLRC